MRANRRGLLWRREISLVDPAVPATGQPYHEVMELPWAESVVAVQELVARIEEVANKAVASLVHELKGYDVRAIGVVGSADRPLEKIGNFHIRAHAAEGILFRRVLEDAAKRYGMASRAFTEKEIAQQVTPSMAAHLKKLGAAAGPPWRADERAAATAAWLAALRA